MEQRSSSSKGVSRLSAIQNDPTAQVLIIGGGINGIATFRDLALQGIKAVLVEKEDYCSGASAASSHMVHGGVRYLENGEFRLVKESLQERNRLLASAPHYVKPLQTTMPIFTLFSGILSAPLRILRHTQGKPKERGAILIKVGLTMYDFFGRNGGRMPRHEFFGKKKSMKLFPELNKNVAFTATYFDAAMESPERLALDALKDALAAGPNARSANYLAAVGMSDGQVILRDSITGKEFPIRADVVVNTSGPWTDLTNEALGVKTQYMAGTKGSHIVLENKALFEACDNREIFFENSDGRIVLMYPLLGKVLLGTTDIPHDMSEPAVCTEPEVDYFFDLVKYIFPDIEVNRSQIIFRFSGVRPLPKSDDLLPGFVSRDYRIVRTSDDAGIPWLSLVGGKWTTFRALGEHLSSEVLKLLGQERKVSTVDLAIGGGLNFPESKQMQLKWAEQNGAGLDVERTIQLLNRYGTLATKVIAYIQDNKLDTALIHTPAYSKTEIEFLVENEFVLHLSDIVHRRTSLAFTGEVNRQMLVELAGIVGKKLGWTAEEMSAEIDNIQIEKGVAA
ncbi:MAG: glycerol-3-phosphate dehydrogenase/oxidase [Aquiluna sp.]|nr:glycerol-3-phosphate dehydrogenase/oxidase [Aquiluna sp.]MCF8545469.1 glycerol-3-phosphate dehydrogenase/oxidase [Aquiluna sp.]